MKDAIAKLFGIYVLNPYGMLLILFALSWFLMLVTGRPLIDWLRHRKGMKWAPREDTPDTHLQKAGVPSMGGIGIIGAAVFAWLAFLIFAVGGFTLITKAGHFDAQIFFVALLPLIVVLHAGLGYADDLCKATDRGGLSSKAKLLGQVILATLFLGVLAALLSVEPTPASDGATISLNSPLLIVIALLVVIGTSNAVNLTDGIDGLAAGLNVQVALVFGALFLEGWQNRGSLTSASATFFWPALGGACLGFLSFNKYPAKVFMGDTGSLALGAALGAGAILTRTVWLLPFVGFIFYVEMFSVIAQVLYFKYTRRKFGEGRRLFRRAPLHHHFELGGWSEWRVVGTFWAINLVTTIVGLVLWKLGVLPRFP